MKVDRISIEVYQQDWMPGFAAFLASDDGLEQVEDGSARPSEPRFASVSRADGRP
jgi:hypothetical protein